MKVLKLPLLLKAAQAERLLHKMQETQETQAVAILDPRQLDQAMKLEMVTAQVVLVD